MICPHCKQSITYRQRNNNQCSKCYKEYAFEPKTHPLQITDNYFSKVVDKLSANGKYNFTPEQLRFALSRRKMKTKGEMIVIVILAIVTSIIALVVYAPLIILVILFWVIVILAQLFYFREFVALPQTFPEFENSVIARWKSIYGKLPPKMIVEEPERGFSSLNLSGILFCETADTANFIIANRLNIKFGLAVLTKPTAEFSQLPKNLPVYVLHDASPEGYGYLKKLKDHCGGQRQIMDLGLRPRSVINSKLMRFRQRNYAADNVGNLSKTEKDWLNQGYYTPLYVLRPAQLIQYVSKQIEQKSKKVTVDNSEKQARAIGFMTWAGEK